MEQDLHLGNDLSELERALRELVPGPARLDVAQTMFRAGQASARGQLAGRRFWPAAAALLAVVSGILGTLLAIPDQPRIVYLWKDRAEDRRVAADRARVAEDGRTTADRRTAVESIAPEGDRVGPDARWLNRLSHVRLSGLTTDDVWSLLPNATAATEPAKTTALCLRDWPLLLEDAGERMLPKDGEAAPRHDWTDLLHLQDL